MQKTNVSQTREAELNVHPLGLISKWPCKHFHLCNANNITLKESIWTSCMSDFAVIRYN